MKRYLFLLLMAIAGSAKAQYYSKYFSLAADFNKPVVNKEFISHVSTRGLKLGYKEFINDRFSVGGELGMATYNDYIPPYAYQQDNTTIYTDIYAYVYNYTLALSGEYFFTTDKIVMPYVGFGIGAAYNQFTMYYNVYQQQDNRWGALIRPHSGAILRFGKKSNWGLMADLHFDYATTKSSDMDYNKGFANMGLQVGLAYLKR
jgi:outer membrane protein W